ncbi:MAG TPA: nucleotide exchange factor GrpE [Thermomicrobiales bacterium]|nr:nucleotide exchange factor GrpE [Thermomicrobiales bacterium]
MTDERTTGPDGAVGDTPGSAGSNGSADDALDLDLEDLVPADGIDDEDIDIDALIAERDSYQDQFTRARADYQNLRRRVESERATARQQVARDILLQLLPVVDDFERAMSNAPTAEDQQTWVSGTRMVGKKMLSILERNGVRRYESVGQPFDPRRHEAVATDGAGTHVVEAYQEGYLLGDTVLRPAMVRTGDAPASSGEDGAAESDPPVA